MDGGGLPDRVMASITQVPLEWALPVKKDRRFKPPFQVAVTVESTGQIDCNIVVTPSVLTEEQFLSGVYTF